MMRIPYGIVLGMTLLQDAETLVGTFEEQGRLIKLPDDSAVIFVGDTHGDLDATERVFSQFPPQQNTLVFLGDTVDRGPDSEATLRLVLQTKREHPDRVFLLMGNHEAWGAATFSPADFWRSLDPQTADALAEILLRLPYAALHASGVLALHGALPRLTSVMDIDSVEPGSRAWRAMTWGDWHAEGRVSVGGRPGFGRDDFESRARQLGIDILVRSHQPSAPRYLFDSRCLTLFTSSAYGDSHRSVARLEPGRTVRTARDLDLIEI